MSHRSRKSSPLPSLARFSSLFWLDRDYPGLRLVFHPHSFFGRLPRLPGINIGDQFVARHRSARSSSLPSSLLTPLTRNTPTVFSDRNPTDIISLVSFFPAARAFLVADPVAIKTILNDRVRFQKRPELDGPLGIFGVNVAVAEGEVWRRHRRVVVGSMSEVRASFPADRCQGGRADVFSLVRWFGDGRI